MDFIKRKLYKDLKKHLSKKEITLLVGARQVGKTTLLLKLKDELEKENTLYISLDEDKEFFTDQKKFLNYLNLELGNSGYVFIDEIQRKENAGLFLKGIYDYVQRKESLNYKFIVSGSGSLELKEKVHESLAGRKRMFELGSVSFKEFVNYRTNYKYENKLKDYFEIKTEEAFNFFKEYFNFGGYPRVVTSSKMKEKREIMKEIIESYLEKDIKNILNLRKEDVFRKLIRILSSQVGSLLNYNRLASEVGVDVKTLKRYLYYGEKTFVLKFLSPFYKNKRKEIVKSPIVYFKDVGFRNYLFGSFGVEREDNKGLIFENFVYTLLFHELQFSDAEILFWRTQTGAEVDFIVKRGQKKIPIEVKYSELSQPQIGKSLHSFIKKYNPQKALIVNLNFEKEIKEKETIVKFIPFYKLITEKII